MTSNVQRILQDLTQPTMVRTAAEDSGYPTLGCCTMSFAVSPLLQG